MDIRIKLKIAAPFNKAGDDSGEWVDFIGVDDNDNLIVRDHSGQELHVSPDRAIEERDTLHESVVSPAV